MTRSSSPQHTTPRPEVAVLFGAVSGGTTVADPLDELAGLAEAADVGVAGRLVQRIARPNPSTYLGTGKVDELKSLVKATGADLALADMDLSPAQARNLSLRLGVRVVDRSELIMDIFAGRARTAQAKLQVELAQLKYALPRLRGQWSHLDRYVGGGVGTRGPGEKQLETDRRIVRKRIRDLEHRLSVFERRKALTLAGRTDMRKVALAGYTNTGKSTLFNRLTDAGVLTANRLFATLDTRTRRWPIPDCDDVLLSDTVGFIRDLPHHLVASFHATLEEVIEADLVLHVVDATDPDAHRSVATVNRVLAAIGAGDLPTLMVLNKIDAIVDRMDLQVLLNADRDAIGVSARTGENLEGLAAAVAAHFSGRTRRYALSLPVSDGRSLARVRQLADVLESESDEEQTRLVVSVQERQVGRLRAWAASAGVELALAG